ncbi:MAG: hypothetical protein LW808_000345 [Verrucomicrobiota bacterium]|nr:MAG: hypothetical protein LW808_000345 [Verrucomicrobiota bacterium]
MREVYSLTDILLSKTYPDPKLKGLSEAELANQAETVLGYRIAHMTDAMFCYTPNVKANKDNGLYQLPEIDITEMTSVGVAMAMLIISTLQNELMLDTQLDGIKCTQNQKLGASNTKILETKKAIRKSRYKSPFQLFMEKLNKSGIMKFLNSNYGKIVMFLIGAATTIASFGTAGPAVIAIGSVLLAFQAAELILGKSMGELLTQGMSDDKAKMALQMSIDMAFMVADIANGALAGAKAGASAMDKAADAAKEVQKATKVIEDAQKATRAASENLQAAKDTLKTLKEAGEASEDTIKALEDGVQALEEGTKKLDKLVEDTQATQKALHNALNSEDAVGILKNSQKLEGQLNDITQQAQELNKSFGQFANTAKANNLGVLAQGSNNVADLMDGTMVSGADLLRTFHGKFDDLLSDPKYLEGLENGLKEGRKKVESLQAELKQTDVSDVKKVNELNAAISEQKEFNQQLVKQIDLIDAGNSLKLAEDVRNNAQHELESSKVDDATVKQFQDGDLTIAEMQGKMREGKFKDIEQSLDIRNFEKNQQIKRANLQEQLDQGRESLKELRKDLDSAETNKYSPDQIQDLGDQIKKQDLSNRKLVEEIDFIDSGYDAKRATSMRGNAEEIAGNAGRLDGSLGRNGMGALETRLRRGDATMAEIRESASSGGFDDVAKALDTGSGGYADAEFGAYTVHGNFLSSSNRTATGGTRRASQALSGIATGARAIAGLRGLEHLNIFQQIMIASQRLQNMVQATMQFYQSLYNLALNEETNRNTMYAAEVDAINTRYKALDEFYQMIIDNQMADIQSLMSYVKASYERAAEAIREYGETNMEIIRNITV